jgi:hypothetical protein
MILCQVTTAHITLSIRMSGWGRQSILMLDVSDSRQIPSKTVPCTLAEACAEAVALAMAMSKAWPDAAAAARLLPDVALTKESAIALAVAVATAFAVDDACALPEPPAPAADNVAGTS